MRYNFAAALSKTAKINNTARMRTLHFTFQRAALTLHQCASPYYVTTSHLRAIVVVVVARAARSLKTLAAASFPAAVAALPSRIGQTGRPPARRRLSNKNTNNASSSSALSLVSLAPPALACAIRA